MATAYDASYNGADDYSPTREEAFMRQQAHHSPKNGRSGPGFVTLNNAMDVAAVLMKAGQSFVAHQRRNAKDFGNDTPASLRYLCFLGGLILTFANTLAVMNVLTLFTSPPVYILQVYQLIFGLIIITLEAKDWDCFDALKPFLKKWFQFLTVASGRGAFYLFVGSLGVSLWLRSFAAFAIGVYMTAMGIACLVMHAGSFDSTAECGEYSVMNEDGHCPEEYLDEANYRDPYEDDDAYLAH